MKKFISFSGGVESTTMCILYGKGATAIWCDTGSEHRPMYDRMDMIEKQLTELHGGDFRLVRLKGDEIVKGQHVDNLEDYAKLSKFLPNQQRRYCTGRFKIDPIDQYLRSLGEVELMIGLNADEEDGRTGNHGLMKNVHYTYPLIEAGLTREDCENILDLHGLHPNFPVYMLRGGCRICFFKSEKEYKAMAHLDPAEFDEIIAIEEHIQDVRKKNFAILRNGKTMRQIKAEVEQEKALFFNIDWSEIYKTKEKQKTCGAFCNR